MIDLKYSLIIEATEDPNFFGFYSPDLKGFTGVGHSVEDCIYQARHGMAEFIEVIKTNRLTVPKPKGRPTVTIMNTPTAAKPTSGSRKASVSGARR